MIKFHYNPPTTPLALVHVDEALVVINKPSGLLSNPGIAPETHDCALSRLQQQLGEIYLVHRLDCDTSGLLVFARSKAAERHLKIQWQQRQVNKTYLAEVDGEVQTENGCLNAPLIADKSQPPLQKVCYQTGKPAETFYRVLSRREHSSKLELKPTTGRTHQLRVHLLEFGHPILGDPFYGGPTNAARAPRLCLHAQSLEFTHPLSNLRLSFSSDDPF